MVYDFLFIGILILGIIGLIAIEFVINFEQKRRNSRRRRQ